MYIKKYVFLLILVIKSAAAMYDDGDPQKTVWITSFFHSLMSGNCTVREGILEFRDYRDHTLIYQTHFSKVQQIINSYSKMASSFKEPVGQIIKTISAQKKPRSCDIEFLIQDLTLQEAKEIQLFYFFRLLERSKIRSMHTVYVKSFLNALYGLHTGTPIHFNNAMRTIKESGQIVPNPMERIENLVAGAYQ